MNRISHFYEFDTTNEMKTGLTPGKYAPLHTGYQYVIDTALREMDKLIVIAYDAPDVTSIPLIFGTIAPFKKIIASY